MLNSHDGSVEATEALVPDLAADAGLIDLLLVGAVTEDDQVMLALIPALEGEELHPTAELSLAAMSGTHNVALELERVAVAHADVVLMAPRPAWALATP